MAKFNFQKNSFLAGEVSPAAQGRTDITQFQHACKTLYNAVALVSGGARNRAGSRYIQTVNANVPAVLIPFIVSQSLAYAVELSEAKIRIIIASTGGFATVNTVGGGTAASATWSLAQAREIQFVQSADVMWLVHPDLRPIKLSLTTIADTFYMDDAFTSSTGGTVSLSSQIQIDSQAFKAANVSSQTITPSGVTGTINVTLSAGDLAFTSGMSGAFFRINEAATDGWVKLKTYSSPTVFSADVIGSNLAATAAVTDWSEGAWSTRRGFPRSITFFGDRLVYGGNAEQPDTLWYSKVANYNYFRTPTTGAVDSDANHVTINSRQLNSIQWLVGKDRLAVGTLGGEHTIDSLSTGSAGFNALSRSSHGSAFVLPEPALNALLFVDRSGRRVREFIFDYSTDSYVSDDLSVWASHLPGKTSGIPSVISRVTWQRSEGILWCVDDSGGLFGMTHDRKQQLSSWHHHELGGSGGNGAGGPIIQSACCIPNTNGHDDLWLSISRTTAAGVLNTVEVIRRHFEYDNITNILAVGNNSCVYLDCATVSNTGSPVTSISGLTHLNGETLGIFGDGYYQGTAVVSGGAITVPSSTQVVVGIPYRTIIEPLPVEAGSQVGSAQGSIKRIDRLQMRFHRTLGAKFGRDESNLEEVTFRDDSMAMGSQIPFFTGEKILAFSAHPDASATLMVVQDLPFPMTLVSVAARGDTRDS